MKPISILNDVLGPVMRGHTDPAAIPVDQNPSLEISKAAAVADGVADEVGDVINYTIRVENTGNTTLTGVTVTDPFVSNLTRVADDLGNNDNDLEVGEKWSYTAKHTVTQAEIDSNGGGDGDLDNIAYADSDQTAPDSDTEEVPVAQFPSLNIVKTANPLTQVADQAGELISPTRSRYRTPATRR